MDIKNAAEFNEKYPHGVAVSYIGPDGNIVHATTVDKAWNDFGERENPCVVTAIYSVQPIKKLTEDKYED